MAYERSYALQPLIQLLSACEGAARADTRKKRKGLEVSNRLAHVEVTFLGGSSSSSSSSSNQEAKEKKERKEKKEEKDKKEKKEKGKEKGHEKDKGKEKGKQKEREKEREKEKEKEKEHKKEKKKEKAVFCRSFRVFLLTLCNSQQIMLALLN